MPLGGEGCPAAAFNGSALGCQFGLRRCAPEPFERFARSRWRWRDWDGVLSVGFATIVAVPPQWKDRLRCTENVSCCESFPLHGGRLQPPSRISLCSADA